MYWCVFLHAEQIPVSYQYLNECLGPTVGRGSAVLDPPKLEEASRDPIHPLPTSVTFTTQTALTKK